jgi:hypothetical protein
MIRVYPLVPALFRRGAGPEERRRRSGTEDPRLSRFERSTSSTSNHRLRVHPPAFREQATPYEDATTSALDEAVDPEADEGYAPRPVPRP